MKIVGLAGGSGTGKSTVAAHLTMRGGAHIDADIVAHEILASNRAVGAKIRERIGGDVFGPDGVIDRRLLGARVFHDAGALAALEEILHPVIREECARRIGELEAAGVPFAVVDAALLLETPMPFRFDLMIALVCNEAVQFERLMAMGGRSAREVRARLASQARIAASLDAADVVVDTCRPMDVVLAEIDALIDGLMNAERA